MPPSGLLGLKGRFVDIRSISTSSCDRLMGRCNRTRTDEDLHVPVGAGDGLEHPSLDLFLGGRSQGTAAISMDTIPIDITLVKVAGAL